jgi:hypothetical protein
MARYSIEDQKKLEEILEEGFLRRFANKIVGGFSKQGMRDVNKIHEFAQSAAYDLGKDISKIFGGNAGNHTQQIYNLIKNYVETSSTNKGTPTANTATPTANTATPTANTATPTPNTK